MKKYLIFLLAWPLFAGLDNLDIDQAIAMLKNKNLELKISHFNEQMKAYETAAAKGNHYGKLDVSVSGMRSNDAGNVFGFKLQSREATFGDFGAQEFFENYNSGADPFTPPPQALNYPEARNHYQTKISYMLPLYTGGKLSEYGRITEAMHRMSQWDTQKLINEKIFQTKKAFYDISLVENYIVNLSKIIQNISRLEVIVKSMGEEGYTQEIDLLEVQARKAEAESMYNQAKLNKDLAYQFLSFLLNTEVSSIKKVNDMAPLPKVEPAEVENHNIDIQKALLGLQISEMAVNVEKANYLPTVGAFGEYGSADDEMWNEFRDKDAYTVGIQLKWNIFNGGIDAANLEKAKVNHLKVQNEVSLAKSGIALKVKKLQTEILSRNADVKSYQKQLRFARKVYENYRSRYQEGIVSISDVLMKQSKELEVLLKLLTLKNERNTKIFELNSILNRGGNV
ncbi:TolC family protein [Sulfurovum sp. XTW-4]|uniref:TolC family protein n=1 Tax=Sulfurovum xiamenensis TaxID=3019066 RepID=A0ABT7QU77_9BACT|nr:TolC family protein [Sulfurovum xiamenensis]MDM5264646.1 TolC family protein [Sulfurovum xiamenensis]